VVTACGHPALRLALLCSRCHEWPIEPLRPDRCSHCPLFARTVTRLLPSQPASCPCPGSSITAGWSVAACTRHVISPLHAHVLAWLLHMPSQSCRPHPACRGDPSTDSVCPLSSVHHDQWGHSLCVGRERSPPSISLHPFLHGLVALPIDPTSPRALPHCTPILEMSLRHAIKAELGRDHCGSPRCSPRAKLVAPLASPQPLLHPAHHRGMHIAS
jgi:hypothetical protein